jgi:hypothetical protein
MPLFRRHRAEPPSAAQQLEASRFTGAASARGWQPVTPSVFDSRMVDAMGECTNVFHGYTRRLPGISTTYGPRVHDVFRATPDGREVLVANAWTNITGGSSAGAVAGVSVCAAELPALISLVCIQPRTFKPVVTHIPEVSTGDAAFDARFMVMAAPGLPAVELTAEMQRLISAREDWIFRVEKYLFACFGNTPFESVDEMAHRIDEVLRVIAAFPESIVPSRVDHTQDDLIAKINRLDSVDDALSLLQQLTPEDRERLATSDTPLAGFADVKTPEEAIARFQALDPAKRLQILAMFERVTDDER